MKLTMELPDDKIEELIREVMQNMPEYGVNLSCRKWKYASCEYVFCDPEDGSAYTVDLPKLKAGFEKMVRDMFENGRLKGLVISQGKGELMDGCNWDADCVDALVQYAVFGEAIYG